MEIILAYLAGLLTLINPCVLPVLPIVLATALQASPLGPAALAGGMSLSFVTIGVGVISFGRGLGISSDLINQLGAVFMIGFGLVILVPQLSAKFIQLTAAPSYRADQKLGDINRMTFRGQLVGGILLGTVWSPCVGPTLGGAIALASQGENLSWAIVIMSSFSLGVASLILGLGYGTRNILRHHRTSIQMISSVAQPVLGAVFLLVGTALVLNLHHRLEIWALDALPEWLLDLSVSI
ncbi:MAG: cytochrome c biogenesis CcdA family protein [Paracoccaceae bacterium]|nr:cytochrome c biogenesis CcdA family protein [Paracoccaceae bacterium]